MKVGLLSGFRLMRCALATWLPQAGDFTVAASIDSADDYRSGVQACPDVWLIEVAHIQELPESIRRLKDLCPNVPMLAMLQADGSESAEEAEAIKAGARGLVSWDSEPEVFVKALETVGRGEVWLSDKATKGYI